MKVMSLKSNKTKVQIMSVVDSVDESARNQEKEDVEKLSNSVNQEESHPESNASSPLSSQPESNPSSPSLQEQMVPTIHRRKPLPQETPKSRVL